MLRLLATLAISTTLLGIAVPALAIDVRGAHAIICRTPEQVVAFNQATALLTDAQYDDMMANMPSDAGCHFIQVTGRIEDTPIYTFVRRDNRVVDVLTYRPAWNFTMAFYTFIARPSSTAAGL